LIIASGIHSIITLNILVSR